MTNEIEYYLRALAQEVDLQQKNRLWHNAQFQTLYVGGGTPSLLTVEQLANLLERIQSRFAFSAHPEITLEANPETVDLNKFIALKQLGFNRLNLGIQSLRNCELHVLERIHNAERARTAILEAQKAGFKNIGIDLIFAIPGQTLENWQQNLNDAVAFNPVHISTYGLTIEAGTPLARSVSDGILKKPDETVEQAMYAYTMHFLKAHGYEHYEISNFAQPAFRSQHNQIYWQNEPYLGLGASAHSFEPPRRSWNVANFSEYIARLSKKILPCENVEILSREQAMIEFIMLGLRIKEGISLTKFTERFHANFLEMFKSVLFKLDLKITGKETPLTGKFLKLEEQHLALTEEGFMVYDEICAQFVAEIDDT